MQKPTNEKSMIERGSSRRRMRVLPQGIVHPFISEIRPLIKVHATGVTITRTGTIKGFEAYTYSPNGKIVIPTPPPTMVST